MALTEFNSIRTQDPDDSIKDYLRTLHTWDRRAAKDFLKTSKNLKASRVGVKSLQSWWSYNVHGECGGVSGTADQRGNSGTGTASGGTAEAGPSGAAATPETASVQVAPVPAAGNHDMDEDAPVGGGEGTTEHMDEDAPAGGVGGMSHKAVVKPLDFTHLVATHMNSTQLRLTDRFGFLLDDDSDGPVFL